MARWRKVGAHGNYRNCHHGNCRNGTATVTATTVAAFGAIAIVLLIVLLVTKELAMASDRPFAARLRKAVNLAVAPMLLTVLAITVAKVALIIR